MNFSPPLSVDNLYTSTILFYKLTSHHNAACGTIHQTCVRFPKTTNTLSKSAERGDMRWLQKDRLLFVKWKTTKEVTACSTFHKAYRGATIERKSRSSCFNDTDVPDPVRDYNKFMGGMELSDVLIQYYIIRGKDHEMVQNFLLPLHRHRCGELFHPVQDVGYWKKRDSSFTEAVQGGLHESTHRSVQSCCCWTHSKTGYHIILRAPLRNVSILITAIGTFNMAIQQKAGCRLR